MNRDLSDGMRDDYPEIDVLPDGVHELSWESQVTLANAYLRGQRIARRHTKRDPE